MFVYVPCTVFNVYFVVKGPFYKGRSEVKIIFVQFSSCINANVRFGRIERICNKNVRFYLETWQPPLFLHLELHANLELYLASPILILIPTPQTYTFSFTLFPFNVLTTPV